MLEFTNANLLQIPLASRDRYYSATGVSDMTADELKAKDDGYKSGIQTVKNKVADATTALQKAKDRVNKLKNASASAKRDANKAYNKAVLDKNLADSALRSLENAYENFKLEAELNPNNAVIVTPAVTERQSPRVTTTGSVTNQTRESIVPTETTSDGSAAPEGSGSNMAVDDGKLLGMPKGLAIAVFVVLGLAATYGVYRLSKRNTAVPAA